MYLGIDFGTSFSQVSTIYLDQPLLLLNPGEYGIPSEFYYDNDCGILIGQDALDAGQGDAAINLVSEVKMSILSGQSFTLDGRSFSAKEIIKEIYKTLIQRAVQVAKKRSVNTNIEGVVISVPVKFGMQEKALISDAARECLDGERIPIKAVIKEPVAAAIAYYKNELEDNKHVLVYDLGGGTCDIALVRSDSSSSDLYTVVDSDMLRIGGRNWDDELIKYITTIIESKSGVRISGNIGYEEKIRRAAIAVKHDLSDQTKTRALARVEINGRIHTVPITRAVFDEITHSLLMQTIECIQDVYERNALSCDIDEIICVGGSSNMLQVEEGLQRAFPSCNIRLYEPEHAVVNGAAFFADMPGTTITDSTNFSYGTETNTHYGYSDNRYIVSNIIMRNDKLPAQNQKIFYPVEDNQRLVLFNIYESEIENCEYDFSTQDKKFIGCVHLKLPPNYPKSRAITCHLSLNSIGVLEVQASEPSGQKVTASFQLNSL